MKKILALVLAALMLLSLVACGSDSAATDTTASTDTSSTDTAAPAASSDGAKLRFVTGGESGTYYAFGSVLAQHATNNAGVNIVGLVGNGSQSNIFELADGNADLAFCQSDVMAYAYDGTNLFEQDGKVDCFSTAAVILARDDVSEDAIYAFTKDIFDNAASLTESHAKYKEIDTAFGASITSVPYHPGAAKYFAEQGITVPTK